MSRIILGGVILPKPTTMPELDFSPVILYSKESITGRLHNVYQIDRPISSYGNYDNIRFNQKFKFEIINLTYQEWQSLDAIDGTKCTLRFERDTYTEEYKGYLDCTFFKFDAHNYFDAVNIEFIVTKKQVPEVFPNGSLMWIGHLLTPEVLPNNSLMWIGERVSEPVNPNDSLMWIGEQYVPTSPTITKAGNLIIME